MIMNCCESFDVQRAAAAIEVAAKTGLHEIIEDAGQKRSAIIASLASPGNYSHRDDADTDPSRSSSSSRRFSGADPANTILPPLASEHIMTLSTLRSH
jgi:hypothetical protein